MTITLLTLTKVGAVVVVVYCVVVVVGRLCVTVGMVVRWCGKGEDVDDGKVGNLW